MNDISKYIYKYEMHVHERYCSACAVSTPCEMVEAYKKAGYSGFIFTDHFLRGNSAVNRALPWREKMLCYYNAYKEAADFGEQHDFSVFFGLEHQYGDGKEVLTYGVDLDFLLANENLDSLPLQKYSQLVWEHGGFISMAHPFRRAGFINPLVQPLPQCLDAVEVFNACNNSVENDEALKYALSHKLIMTSGGDIHDFEDSRIGKAGIALSRKAKNIGEIISALRSHDFALIIDSHIIFEKDLLSF